MASNEYIHKALDILHSVTYDVYNLGKWFKHPQGSDILDKLQEVMDLLAEVDDLVDKKE